MIYFENHNQGRAGFNNHVIPFTLCTAISNFLERDFYFDHEVPSFTLPHVHLDGSLKNELEHVVSARRCLVTDLLEIPNRRVFEIDRNTSNKLRVDDPMLTFMTDEAQREKFGETMIWNFFSLGRTPLVREELDQFDLIEFGPNSVINADFFFFLEREQKWKLLDSIRIKYRSEYEDMASRIISAL